MKLIHLFTLDVEVLETFRWIKLQLVHSWYYYLEIKTWESQFYKLSTAMLISFILVSSFSPRPTTFKPFCPLRSRTVWDIRCKRITMSLKVETFLSMGTVNNDLVWPLGGASQPLTSCLFSFFLLFCKCNQKKGGRGWLVNRVSDYKQQHVYSIYQK